MSRFDPNVMTMADSGHWILGLPDDEIVRAAGGPAYRQGVSHVRAGAVHDIEIGEVVQARVEDGSTHVTMLRAGPPHTLTWLGTCPCAVGSDCSHAVALLLGARGILRERAKGRQSPPAFDSLLDADLATEPRPPEPVGQPRLALTATFTREHAAWLEWSWVYALHDIDAEGTGSNNDRAPKAGTRVIPVADRTLASRTASRDPAAEQALLDALYVGPLADRRDMLVPVSARPRLISPVSLRGMGTATFVEHVLPGLQHHPALDVTVVGETAQYGAAVTDPVVHVTLDDAPNSDWFDLAVMVTVDGEHVQLADLVRALTLGRKRLLLPSGTHFSLDSPTLDELRDILAEAKALTDPDRGSMQISLYQVALWDQLVALGVIQRQSVTFSRRLAALRRGCDDNDSAVIEPPNDVVADLRPYQLQGLTWLAALWDARLGGVLADDMGLGKTLQVLGMLQRAREQGDLTSPVLIVAPTSVVDTWVQEAARFTPKLRVVALNATEGKRRGASLGDLAACADVVVTSYTLLRLSEKAYGAVSWQAVVLDEAQFVKNYRAKTYQVVRRLRREVTFAITGTPLENTLMDLWAILSLTSPGLFPDPEAFIGDYRTPIESGQDTIRLASFRRTIRPFVMRRTKAQVAGDLPPKQEQTVLVPMTPAHRRIYDTHLHRERQRVLRLLGDFDRNRVAVLTALTTLRQMALDPALVDSSYAQKVRSAKIDELVARCTELQSEGHRALVFSQFTRYLRQAQQALDAAGVSTVYLDGSTRNRPERIAGFVRGDATAFLISLKAGGFGLNLTQADYVFVLDPWWNPAAEEQAVDRTHRIGQTRPVMVYRLVTADSIEEKVRAMQERKRELFARVLDDGAVFSAALTAADVRDLLVNTQ